MYTQQILCPSRHSDDAALSNLDDSDMISDWNTSGTYAQDGATCVKDEDSIYGDSGRKWIGCILVRGRPPPRPGDESSAKHRRADEPTPPDQESYSHRHLLLRHPLTPLDTGTANRRITAVGSLIALEANLLGSMP